MAGETQDYSLLVPYRVMPVGVVYVPPPTGIAATDTANIQNALNKSTSSSPKRIVLQPGTYQLNATLNVPNAPGTVIEGQGPVVTALRQTSGLHVFSFTNDTTHTITVQGIDIGYNSAQTTPCAVFYYHVAGGTSAGFWNHVYRDLFITYAYDGWRLEENDGPQTLWEASWYNVRTNWGLARSFVRMNPAGAVGIPELNFYNVATFHTPTVAGAQCFVFKACEVQMDGVGVETYTDTAFYIYGGGFLSIRNLHVESHSFAAAQSLLVDIEASTTFVLDGFSISGTNTVANNAFLILFNPHAGSNVTVKNGSHNVVTTNGTPYVTEVLWAGAGLTGTAARVENVTKTGGGLNSPLQGSRGSQVAEYSPMQTPRQYRAVTATYSQQQFDGVIVVNATSAVIVTLLDPTVCMVGVPVTIKNVTANTVTIASAGTSKTIDGAASTTLAQWAKASFISDGTQWLSV